VMKDRARILWAITIRGYGNPPLRYARTVVNSMGIIMLCIERRISYSGIEFFGGGTRKWSMGSRRSQLATSELYSPSSLLESQPMAPGIDVYCSTCFAMQGEPCRTKYLVHGHDEVTPVICPTHNARLVDSHANSIRHLFAGHLLAVALMTLRDK
jgi:hypothetical protein